MELRPTAARGGRGSFTASACEVRGAAGGFAGGSVARSLPLVGACARRGVTRSVCALAAAPQGWAVGWV